MSAMTSRSVLILLILSRLARVWKDTYWSLSIWETRYRSLQRCSLLGAGTHVATLRRKQAP